MTRRIFRLTLLLVMPSAATPQPKPHAQDDSPNSPAPLVVLIEFDPKAFRLVYPHPTFALYEDGTVIYQNEVATVDRVNSTGDTGYRTLQLSEHPLANFLAALHVTAFDDPDPYDRGDDMPDPIENSVEMWQEDEHQFIWVEGDLRNGHVDRQAAPAHYLAVFDQLIAFVGAEHAEAQVWMPDSLIVQLDRNDTLYLDERVAEPGGDWPSNWPHDGDPAFQQTERSRRIKFAGGQYAEVMTFLRTHANAIHLAGKTYRATLRFIFPSETIWREDTSG